MAELYLDHNVAREIAERLREARHGARTASALGMQRAGDEEHLSLAASSGWIVITHNAKDFSLLHAAWRRWSREWKVEVRHAGVLVLIPPVSPARAAEEVFSLLNKEPELSDELYVWRAARGWVRHP